MKSLVYSAVLSAAVLLCPRAFAEEKMVTTPLLTALSSTTISGYIDTSVRWNPGTTNVTLALSNGKTASVSSQDIELLQWAIGAKQFGLLRLYVAMKQQQVNLSAEQFDAKYLPALVKVSGMPKQSAQQVLSGRGTSPF